MSNITKTSKNIKKKLSFDDFNDAPHTSKDTSHQDDIPVSHTAAVPLEHHADRATHQHSHQDVNQPTVITSDQHNYPAAHQHDAESMCRVDSTPTMVETTPLSSTTTTHMMPVPQQTKVKTTFYLDQKTDDLFMAIYIKRLQKRQKTDKSQLICEAIALLHEKEQKE